MKKMILMMMLVMMGVVVIATGKPFWNSISKSAYVDMLSKQAYSQARAYLIEFDFTNTEDNKQAYISTQLRLDVLELKIPDSTQTVKSAVETYAVAVGYTDSSYLNFLVLQQVSARMTSKQYAYDYYKTITKPIVQSKELFLNACVALGKKEEALAVAIELENYIVASKLTAELKDNTASFNYSKKALLGKPATASQVIEILVRLADMDFSDTTVTKAMQIDFLQSINAKYSRLLITDKATWEPVIANVRTTLEGYGVK